mgnify:CR=1 FL=1
MITFTVAEQLEAALCAIEQFVIDQKKRIEQASVLVAKAEALVEMLDDAEKNHGGLVGPKTLRCKNELRLVLSKWS